VHLCEEAAYGIIILAVMQQQKPGIAWCHICCDKQVVETVHSLQGQVERNEQSSKEFESMVTDENAPLAAARVCL